MPVNVGWFPSTMELSLLMPPCCCCCDDMFCWTDLRALFRSCLCSLRLPLISENCKPCCTCCCRSKVISSCRDSTLLVSRWTLAAYFCTSLFTTWRHRSFLLSLSDFRGGMIARGSSALVSCKLGSNSVSVSSDGMVAAWDKSLATQHNRNTER